jgi:hypothetical protein
MVLFSLSFVTSLLFQWAPAGLNGWFGVFPSSAACTTTASDLSALVACHVSLVQRQIACLDCIHPTPSERSAWSQTIQALLDVDGDCSTISLPAPLSTTYTVREVGTEFCALVEVSTNTGGSGGTAQYEKGWGMFVTQAWKSRVKRNLHLSAPHPIFDSLTEAQAGHVFEGTSARSLYIPGRIRDAFLEPSCCIAGSENTTYWKTDSAHDKVCIYFF